MSAYEKKSLLDSTDTEDEATSDYGSEPARGDPKAPPGYGSRHILALMAFLGFVNVYALRVNLSVALVAMVNHTSAESANSTNNECPQSNMTVNSTTNSNLGEFDWDHNLQGLVLSSFFYGYILTQIPGGWLAENYGGKKLYGFGVLCTALLTLITPFAARWHVGALIAVRVLEGIGEGVTFPAMHALWGQWAPVMERSRLCAFCYAGASLGTVISMPISGLLCASDIAGGWPSVFYVFGTIGCIWFVFWMILIHDTPAKHPRISVEERNYIEKSIGTRKNTHTPWLSFFTSPALLAILVAHFCSNWGFYTLLTCLPTYMKEILKFDIRQDGLLSALPYLWGWIIMNVSGIVADCLREKGYLSTQNVRKLFNSLGNFLAALFLIVIQFAGCDLIATFIILTFAVGFAGFNLVGFNINHIDIAPQYAGNFLAAFFLIVIQFAGCDVTATFVILTCAVGFAGFNIVGYGINHIDIAPNYAGTLMGITNTAATIPGMVGPSIVGFLTNKHQTREQWQIVFYIAAGVYLFGLLFYLCFAKGEVQKWAKNDSADIVPSNVTTPINYNIQNAITDDSTIRKQD